MSELFSLAYISRSTIAGPTEAVRHEMRDILAAAHRNNPARGVTGALLYAGGCFCQVIEGPSAVLEALFETIQMDPRHREVTVLHFEPIEARAFSEWAMAFAGIEEAQRFDLDGVHASPDGLKARETGQHMVRVLDQLVRQHAAVADRPDPAAREGRGSAGG